MSTTMSHIVTVEGGLVLMSPLRIGGRSPHADKGASDANNVMPLYDVFEKYLVLPGSSLKGVCRAQVERIARVMGSKVCDPTQTAVSSPRRSCAHKEDLYVCPACQLFGFSPSREGQQSGAKSVKAKGHKSVILFSDALTVKPDGWRCGIRSVTPLNHFSQEVVVPLQEQVVPSGTCFPFSIQLHGPVAWHLRLTAFLLRDLMRERISVGAASSRGLGSVRLDLRRLVIETYGVSEDEAVMRDIPNLGTAQTTNDLFTRVYEWTDATAIEGVLRHWADNQAPLPESEVKVV